MRIDILGLQAFVSIAERGSFQRAAAHLNLSQTALSHRMRKLELDLGLRLLLRTTRQVTLTPAGVELLPRARRIIDDVAETFQQLRQMGEPKQRRVSIGCLPTLAVQTLPQAIAKFSARHPDVAIKVHDNSAGEIAQLVQSGEADFGITILSAAVWDLELKPLLKEPFVAIVPADHAFAKLNAVSWAELAGHPLVRISPQAGNRVLLDDALGSRRDTLNWRFEAQRMVTAVSMVRAGIGVAVAPRLAVEAGGAQGVKALKLHTPSVSRTIGVVLKRGVPLSPPAEELLGILEQRIRAIAGRSGLEAAEASAEPAAEPSRAKGRQKERAR